MYLLSCNVFLELVSVTDNSAFFHYKHCTYKKVLYIRSLPGLVCLGDFLKIWKIIGVNNVKPDNVSRCHEGKVTKVT